MDCASVRDDARAEGARCSLRSVIDDSDLKVEIRRLDPSEAGDKPGAFAAAVRVTHLPTGISVTRDDLQSQAANKAAAIEDLERRLTERDAEVAELEQRVHDDADQDA